MSDNERTLVVVDDDAVWCETVSGALRRRGFDVAVASNLADARNSLARFVPRYALIDLRIGNDSGLAVVEQAAQLDADIRIVVLTGYASIATAVEAVKLGAVQYLSKPVAMDDLVAALTGEARGNAKVAVPDTPPSVRRLEWEHIQRVLHAHDGNISATARALHMHRRTLQRKLNKHPVKR